MVSAGEVGTHWYNSATPLRCKLYLQALRKYQMMSHELSLSDRAEIERLEEAMWQQVTRYDPDFQESRFSQDFFEFGRSGRVYLRNQIIAKQGNPIQAKFPMPQL